MSERVTCNASLPPDNRGNRSIIFGPAELIVFLLPVLGVVAALTLPLVQLIREWLR